MGHPLYPSPNVVINFSGGAEYHPRMILCTFSHSIVRSQIEPSNFKQSDYALRNLTSFWMFLLLLFTRIAYLPEVLYYMSKLNLPNGL